MDVGVFDLGCGNMVRRPSAQLVEASWSPYCYRSYCWMPCCVVVPAAAVVVAEDLMIASMEVKESRSCQLDLRDTVRSPVDSAEDSCIARSTMKVTGRMSD